MADSPSFAVLVAEPLADTALARLSSQPGVAVTVEFGLDKAEMIEAISDYDALIVRSGTTIDADVLAAAHRLKVIGRAGVGVDNIDIEAASLRGIVVTNTPGANTTSAAEHAMALLLAAARHIARSHQSVEAGRWERSEFPGIQLAGKTLGLIGFGRVARAVARRAAAFRMHIVAFDPLIPDEVAEESGAVLLGFDDVLAAGDFISLHAPLTDHTREIIDRSAIERMKPGVVLVNTARGGLIDEVALADALTVGRVRAAAIDVYQHEPPRSESPLVGLPNVTHTPHLGASTYEAQQEAAEEIVDQVLSVLNGSEYRNVVNLALLEGSKAGADTGFQLDL